MKEEIIPYFFLTPNDGYVIGTPKCIAQTDKTFEVNFNDFARNYSLQEKLGLKSLVSKDLLTLYSNPLEERKFQEKIANYLSECATNEIGKNLSKRYLLRNGLIRIIITNNELKEKVRCSLGEN